MILMSYLFISSTLILLFSMNFKFIVLMLLEAMFVLFMQFMCLLNKNFLFMFFFLLFFMVFDSCLGLSILINSSRNSTFLSSNLNFY